MSNDKHTPNGESFGSFMKRVIGEEPSELESLRAEKAQLIEALNDAVECIPYSERTKFQLILRKYETK
jgi:hypothetical protein